MTNGVCARTIVAMRWFGALVRDLVIFAVAFGVVFHFGRGGWHPLDCSIIFDGGWRVLQGQLPHRDFMTPNGQLPILMQAALFKLFGVNWWAYLLHSSLVAGCFAVVAHRLMRLMGVSPWAAIFFALATANVYYVVKGLPYMEQHAFFFALLGLTLAVAAGQASGWRRRLLLLSVGPVFLMAYLSKQIPTVFVIPIALVGCLAPAWRAERPGRTRAEALALLALGGIAAVACVAALAASYGIEARAFLDEVITRPSALGRSRIEERNNLYLVPRMMLLAGGVFLHTAEQYFAMTTIVLAQLIGLPVLLVTLLPRRWLARRPRLAAISDAARPGLPQLALALALIWVGYVFTELTSNHQTNGLCYTFIAVGLLREAALRSAPSAAPADPDDPATADDAPEAAAPESATSAGEGWSARRARGLALVLVLATLVDVGSMTVLINHARVGNGAVFPAGDDPIHPSLAPMRWGKPGHYPVSAAGITTLIDRLRARDEPFFLFGDGSILYGLSGQPSLSPSLWFHPGLAMPLPQNKGEFKRWEDDLMRRLYLRRVRLVVVERREVWTQLSLGQLPQLQTWLSTGRGRALEDGVQFYEVDPDMIYQASRRALDHRLAAVVHGEPMPELDVHWFSQRRAQPASDGLVSVVLFCDLSLPAGREAQRQALALQAKRPGLTVVTIQADHCEGSAALWEIQKSLPAERWPAEPTALDPDNRLAGALGIKHRPAWLVVDRDGRIQLRCPAPTPQLEPLLDRLLAR